ncbi:cellulose synthase subunit BcsC-related outer membrane protein [uncultured Paraglaciecola sp.]|uniref:cellulose synthase subunit BcsC-related outer membrane protein n=1 Tax=uncultured Paraglaciecola sp. TaxID=1765024 RepID=UPI002597DF95|nr:cellulose synthase subunit BcsC-related outer membrane protein [uncultured Paraglaciecola sp.]
MNKFSPLHKNVYLRSLLMGSCLSLFQSSVIAQSSASPDTTGVWYHIKQTQTKLASDELKRLQREFPNWQVPADLSTAIKDMNTTKAPDTVYTHEQKINDQNNAFLGKVAGLSPKDWGILSDSQFSKFRNLVADKGDPNLDLLVGWIYLAKQLPKQALVQFELIKEQQFDGTIVEKAQQGKQAALEQWLKYAIETGKISEINVIEAHHDIDDLLDAAAWSAFEAKDYTQAKLLFDYQENEYGSTLALEKQGKINEATSLACSHTELEALATYCINRLSERQLNTYNQKAFKQSLLYAEQMESIRPLTMGALELKGWSHFELEEYALASDVFRSLHSSNRENNDYSQALYTAVSFLPKRQQLDFRNQYPALESYFKAQSAYLATARKQFDLVASDSSNAYENRQAISVYTGLRGSQRSGADGLEKFHQFNHYLGITKLISDWRLTARIDYEQLYSGRPAEGSWFGSERYLTEQGFHSGIEDKGVSVSAFKQQDDFNLYADIRYLLFDQPAENDITGKLAGVWYIADFTLATSVYKLRKQDSLLSTAGAKAQDGSYFGGVTSTGIKGLFVAPISSNWSLALNGEYAKLSGQNVTDNSMKGFALSASSDMKSNIKYDLDYLRIGPRISYIDYEKNQSLFTVTHGGYFSPKDYLNFSLFAQLLTKEGHDWQVKAELDFGYSRLSEAATYRYLDSEIEAINSSKSSGVNANLRVEGQWRIAKHWVLAGVFTQANAVQYHATSLGVQIRWQPGLKNGLTSDWLIDNNPLQTGYAF